MAVRPEQDRKEDQEVGSKQTIRDWLALMAASLSMVLMIAGCIGQTPSPTTRVVRGVVTVAKGAESGPAGGVVVSLAGRSAVTSSQGAFQITGIAPGTYRAEVSVPSSSSALSSVSIKAGSASSVRVWSGMVNVSSSGDTVLNITVNPFAIVLRLGWGADRSTWQLAFYASPPVDKSIVQGSVTTPNGEVHQMTQHFGKQWHCWWNVDIPEPGTYVESVTLSDGTTETVEVDITEETFTGIVLPGQIAPEDGAELDTTTPYLEYSVPDSAERVYVRIRDTFTNKETWLRDCDRNGVQVPQGILAPGGHYTWKVHTVNRPAVLPWIESLSGERSFTVRE